MNLEQLYRKYCDNGDNVQKLRDIFDLMLSNHFSLRCDFTLGKATIYSDCVYTEGRSKQISSIKLYSNIPTKIVKHGRECLKHGVYIDELWRVDPCVIDALIQKYSTLLDEYTERINQLYHDNADLLLQGSLYTEKAIQRICPYHRNKCGEPAVKSVKLATACMEVLQHILIGTDGDNNKKQNSDVKLESMQLSFSYPVPLGMTLERYRDSMVTITPIHISNILGYSPDMLSDESIDKLSAFISVTRFIMSKCNIIQQLFND